MVGALGPWFRDVVLDGELVVRCRGGSTSLRYSAGTPARAVPGSTLPAISSAAMRGDHVVVRVTSDLPIPADVVADLIRKPALLRYVTWPVLGMPDLPDEEFYVGHQMTVRIYLFGVLPLWRHTVRVVGSDESGGEARTEEHGGPLRAWRHRLVVTPTSSRSCRYTDEVEVDAGPLTPLAVASARAFYRYRHRRWAALARVLA